MSPILSLYAAGAGEAMSSLEVENNIITLLLIFLALVILGVVISYVVERRFKPRRSYFRSRRWNAGRGASDIRDVGQQIQAVMAAKFEKRRLMNDPEYRLFRLIEEEALAERRGHRVFAQANLGEILASPDRRAFASINSKRVDILIVDGGGWPVAAVEYQGKGHYQGTAAARDAVKKEALRKAGVRYVEVCAGDRPDQVRARLREQMGWGAAPAVSADSAQEAPRPHFGNAGLSPELSGSR